jgi:serine/threonine protein phosphatase PrpC
MRKVSLAFVLFQLAAVSPWISLPLTKAERQQIDLASSNDSCPQHGCPLLPLDVVNDVQAKDSFKVLSSSSSSSVERSKALENLRGSGDTSRVVLTLMGSKGGPKDINQDAAIIHSPFLIKQAASSDDEREKIEEEELTGSINNNMIQFVGVFDGHGDGGELTSNFAKQEIPKRLAERLSLLTDGDSITSAITTIPETAVIDALKDIFLEVDQDDPSLGAGGCTATIVVQLGKKLFVANVGDSVSFICAAVVSSSTRTTTTDDQTKMLTVDVIYQTREDKPDLPEERKRILLAGGYVHIPDREHDVPRAYHIDKLGKARYGLAMSRSLGDWMVQGVIAEPIVDVIDLEQIQKSYSETCRLNNNKDNGGKTGNKQKCDTTIYPDSIRFFAVSMSDGMADYLEVDDVAVTLATSFYSHAAATDDDDSDEDIVIYHPLTAAEKLIKKAASIWDADYGGQYRDDIALAAITIPIV